MKDAASRKEFAYEVIRDKRIGALLAKEKYADAKNARGKDADESVQRQRRT